jgi:lipopolysaccharide export system protein LptC
VRAPLRWVVVLLALAALVAVAVQIGAVGDDRTADGPAVTEPNEPAVGSQEFLARLAEQGYIPPEAVDRERLLLERLVQQGRIPAETLN